MKFLDKTNEWSFAFNQGRLTLLKIDFRLTLIIADGSATIELCIETLFTMTNKGAEFICVPENSKSLAPVLTLMNSKVNSVEIKSSGQLILYFDSDTRITVDPDPSYEAWQLGSSMGFLKVCSPEGKVVTFQNHKP